MLKDIRKINSSTDKIIVVFYPSEAGGKFLLNCLGLGDRFVLQDADIAKKQLDNKITKQEIFDELMFRLSRVNGRWNDLNLGCVELFGNRMFTHKLLDGLTLKHLPFNSIVHDLSYGSHYFPLITHNIYELEPILSHWPNARIINLVNYEKFKHFYRPSPIYLNWQQLRGGSWPSAPPETLDQYQQLSTSVQKELDQFGASNWILSGLLWQCDIDTVNKAETSYLNKIFSKNLVFNWNVDCYFDQNLFLKNLENIYNWLDIGEVNQHQILQFYTAYLQKLKQLKIEKELKYNR